MVNIFEYLDYRKFLNDYYAARKKDNWNFSHRFVASRAGFDASTFTKVLKRERNLSLKLAMKLSKILKFSKKEANYFNLLVLFDQTVNHEEKKQYLEQLLSFRATQAKTLEMDQYKYFEKWYYVAIRELLSFYRFTGDYAALAKILQPNILPKEAKKAIAQLEKLGLARKNGQGSFKPTEAHITTGDEWRSLAITNYQLATIRLALEAVNFFPREAIDFSTMTMTLSKNGLAAAKSKIAQLRKDLAALENQEKDSPIVYQANFNLFPLTKAVAGGQK